MRYFRGATTTALMVCPLLLAAAAAPARAQCTSTQELKLIASDPQRLAYYGQSLAISGDTLLVGASRMDLFSGEDAGMAYIYTRSTGPWSEQARLIAPDAQGDDFCAYAAALDGDTAILGAYRSDPGGIDSAGAAYIFTRAGSTWTFQAKLVAPDPTALSLFGFSVALQGDTAVIGAIRADHSGRTDPGAAYVFTRSGTAWTQQAKLIASDPVDNAWFGSALALDHGTVVIGAQLDQMGKGSAYIFSRAGSAWTQEVKLMSTPPVGGSAFGYAVALEGDTAVISNRIEQIGTIRNAGSATVFTRSAGAWSPLTKLVASDPHLGDEFGSAVALRGDRILVGAWFTDPAAISSAGAAYLFKNTAGAWGQTDKLLAGDKKASAFFGSTVALSDDTAFITAVEDQHSGITDFGPGAVYMFDFDGAPWVTAQPPDQISSCPSGSVAFFAAAAGPAPLAYQWRRDGVPITDGPGGASPGGGSVSGAATPNLVINDLQPSDAGAYDLVISNSCGATTSRAVAFTLTECCPADLTLDGVVDFVDYLAFLNYYDAGDLRADLNHDGLIDFNDYEVFLTLYDGGC